MVLTVTASTISFPALNPTTTDTGSTARRRAIGAPTTPAQPTPAFTVADLEFYMTDDGIAYIRPGLVIKVNSVTVGSDRRPVVDLTFTDKFNQPLDRLGQATPGALNISFLCAWYDGNSRTYTSYITRSVTTRAGKSAPSSCGFQRMA